MICGNLLKSINSRAVAVISYGAGIIKWTKEKLKTIDRKTRKMMAMRRALCSQAELLALHTQE